MLLFALPVINVQLQNLFRLAVPALNHMPLQ